MDKIFHKTYQWLDEQANKLGTNEDLKKIFKNGFLSTLEGTTKLMDDGTTYVFTGDIPAMWLRDSSAQVIHYFQLLEVDPEIQSMIRGLIERQFFYINIDPYANAFNESANGAGHQDDITDLGPWIWERKFELDSLAYPVWLLEKYYQASKDDSIFTPTVLKGVRRIIETFDVEMDHFNGSPYTFTRPNVPAHETVANNGRGKVIPKTGLIWSAFRPSDDACVHNYFIPGNAFSYVALEKMLVLQDKLELKKDNLVSKVENMKDTVYKAIYEHGIIEHPVHGKIFAYEVDGLGNQLFMDDANIPSLLALPYIGFCSIDDEIYQNTRRAILSKDNPFYVEGKFAKGVGSPHTPDGYVWHIGIISAALNTNNLNEKKEALKMLLNTHAGTHLMHEGFDPNDPSQFTREWFAWANSLFAYFIIKNFDVIDQLLD